jgi:DNA-binding PadR family transcriptional regulator
MDERGWVTSDWEVDESQGPPRRVYELTAQGDETLAAYVQDLQQTRAQIDGFLKAYERHMNRGEGQHH